MQRRLQAGALGRVDIGVKLDQLPQRRTGTCLARAGCACRRSRRHGIDPLRQPCALLSQRLLLGLQFALQARQFGLALGQPLAGLRLRGLQRQPRRVVALQRADPIGQRLQCLRPELGCGHQLLQTVDMALPDVQQAATLLIHSAVGLLAPCSGFFECVAALVALLPQATLLLLDLFKLGAAASQQRQLFAALGQQSAQIVARGVEGQGVQFGQRWRVGRGQRVQCKALGNAGCAGNAFGLQARFGQRVLGLRGARGAFAQGDAFALRAGLRFPARLDGVFGIALARQRVAAGLLQAIGVLHQRVGLQRLQAGAAVLQGALCRIERIFANALVGLRRLQRGACVVEGAAGPVEAALRAAQAAGLTPRLSGGIDAVAPVELAHRLGQRLVFFQLAAEFLQLVQRIGHVGEQVAGQRRQRLGQRGRQAALIGLLRQLRLAQLDQRVHQRGVARGAQAKQPLVHRAPVADGGVEHLPATRQALAQPLLGQHHALLAGEPQVAAYAMLPRLLVLAIGAFFKHEIPTVDLRARGRCRQAAAQRQVVRFPFGIDAAELDPGVTHAPLVAAEQQVPGHLLAAVAIGLDARRLELRIEQERQRQRQHLRLAGAVVAAQQQVPIVKPELFAVVVKQLDQAQAQRLPARQCGLGQGRAARCGCNFDAAFDAGLGIWLEQFGHADSVMGLDLENRTGRAARQAPPS